MPWPSLFLGLIAFLSTQASSGAGELEMPSLMYPDYAAQEEGPADSDPLRLQRHLEDKRALTLLSRLAPIRKVFRQGEEADRHFDPRSFGPRWHSNLYQRAPGPLRWG